MKFVVDEETWCRGGKNLSSLGDSLLLTDKGTQCCLGFRLQSAKIPTVCLDDKATPSCVSRHRERIPKYLLREISDNDMEVARNCGVTETEIGEMLNHCVQDILIVVNDDPSISDDKRKEVLTRLFAAYGDKVVFQENRQVLSQKSKTVSEVGRPTSVVKKGTTHEVCSG